MYTTDSVITDKKFSKVLGHACAFLAPGNVMDHGTIGSRINGRTNGE